MLSVAHVRNALEAKRQAFTMYGRDVFQTRQRYEGLLAWLSEQSNDDLTDALSSHERPGARPTREHTKGRPMGVIIPWQQDPVDHEQARSWALDILKQVPTLAVDGSQIFPSADFSIPVGAVQIGWFENPHDPGKGYKKDIHFEILAPRELADEGGDASVFSGHQVNLRRFEGECERLIAYMRDAKAENPPPVCFFDGSLAISFAAQMAPALRRRYISAVHAMIKASEETRVPVVGYVAASNARDLTTMLQNLANEDRLPPLSDGALLRSYMAWGDRTESFLCARDDQLFEEGNEHLDYYDHLLFLYLKTTSQGAPERLDVPAWVLEDGLLPWVIDIMRAECIVGRGYPYAIETADATAVITREDQERFYRLFQEFLEKRVGLNLRYSRKAYSKRRRR
ncbi:MAG: DNA double-strand break repair nuclease NurA [Chloroflexota bacterium]|nr:DNA double-strand break repair nuclease NurA [Chloroflexota bacterium]